MLGSLRRISRILLDTQSPIATGWGNATLAIARQYRATD